MEENKKITSRLDAIIFLMFCMLKDKESLPKLTELFYQMKQMGLTNEELGNIFGRTPDQIAKAAYEFKRPVKNKKGNTAK